MKHRNPLFCCIVFYHVSCLFYIQVGGCFGLWLGIGIIQAVQMIGKYVPWLLEKLWKTDKYQWSSTYFYVESQKERNYLSDHVRQWIDSTIYGIRQCPAQDHWALYMNAFSVRSMLCSKTKETHKVQLVPNIWSKSFYQPIKISIGSFAAVTSFQLLPKYISKVKVIFQIFHSETIVSLGNGSKGANFSNAVI